MAEESVKLFPLKDLTDGGTNPREYDVVAVHRWGGNEMSWKREGDKIRWLEDLLPSRIGSARVMSFNYRFLGRQGISTLGIRNTALALLKKLAEEQSPEYSLVMTWAA
ncbi:hypothetical protein GQ53DRAFT_759712 [Thozetella sp. PMI_491]|nr:hypothetical protein GQ53DRAFT_759712 [Thozetella sp. PMI_491]